jgi:hypothetical protein
MSLVSYASVWTNDDDPNNTTKKRVASLRKTIKKQPLSVKPATEIDEYNNHELVEQSEEIPNFQKLFKQKYDQAVKEYEIEFPPSKKSNKKNAKSNLSYAVVGDRWIKRSWYKLTIYEEFDFSKIIIHISRDVLFGQDSYAETFRLSYGDIEFDFYENNGANSDSCELMSSDGKSVGFEVLDEEYDDEDEENDDD